MKKSLFLLCFYICAYLHAQKKAVVNSAYTQHTVGDLTVFLQENTEVPLLQVKLLFKSPWEKSAALFQWLDLAQKERAKQDEWQKTVQSLGAFYQLRVEGVQMVLPSNANALEKMLKALDKTLINPSWEKTDIDNMKAQYFLQFNQEPLRLVDLQFRENSMLQSKKYENALESDDVFKKKFDAFYNPLQAILVVEGAMKSMDMLNTIKKVWGTWRGTPPIKEKSSYPAQKKGAVFLQNANAQDASLFLFQAYRMETVQNWLTMYLLWALLSQNNLAENTTEVHLEVWGEWQGFCWQFDLQKRDALEIYLDALQNLQNIVRSGVEKEKFELAKKMVLQHFWAQSEQSGVASTWLGLQVQKGVQFNLFKVPEILQDLNMAQWQNLLEKMLAPEDLNVLVLGNRKQILPFQENFGKEKIVYLHAQIERPCKKFGQDYFGSPWVLPCW